MDANEVRLEILALLARRRARRRAGWQVPALLGDYRERRLRRLLLLRLARFRQQRLAQLRAPRRWFRRPTYHVRLEQGAWRTTVRTMMEEDEEEFFKLFRVTPRMFAEVLARLRPLIGPRRVVAGGITPDERLAVTLHYLANGCHMKTAGGFLNIPPSTVSKIVLEVCLAVWEEFHEELFPAFTEERLRHIMEGFWEKWQFPNCIGALDGRHCIVQNFPNGASDWFNYKGSFSMVMLAMCDADYKLTWIEVGGRGRRNDAGLWDESSLNAVIQDGTFPMPPVTPLPGTNIATPPVIVADDAFPLGPHLLKPFPGHFLADPKRVFNYRLSRARRVIENVFGILSARWRVLRRPFIAAERTAKAVIKAVACLHNLLVLNEENVPPHQRWYIPPQPEGVQNEEQQVQQEVEVVEHRDGREVREVLTDFFLSEVGAMDRQWGCLLNLEA